MFLFTFAKSYTDITTFTNNQSSIHMKKFTFTAFVMLFLCITAQHTRAEENTDAETVTLCSFYDGSGNTFSGWGDGTMESVEEDGKPCFKFTNTEEKTNSWDIQACIAADFIENTQYTIEFDVKGTPATFNWDFQNSNGYQGRGYTDKFDVTPEWTHVSIKGTPNGYGTDHMLLCLGKYVGTLYISDVKITYKRLKETEVEVEEERRAIEVSSDDKVEDRWDTQFWIMTDATFKEGDTWEISMNIRADKDASSSTQIHANPGEYVHYEGIGNPRFTKTWTTYTATGTFPDAAAGGHSIAFLLNEFPQANNYYFDDISFKINGVEMVKNGSCDDDNMKDNFFAREKRGEIGPARFVDRVKNVIVSEGIIYSALGKNPSGSVEGNFISIDDELYAAIKSWGASEYPIAIAGWRTVTPHKKYILSFDIMGTSAEEKQCIKIYYGNGKVKDITFDITDKWQRVTREITAEDSAMSIGLLLGAFEGAIYITNIFVYDALDSPELPELPSADVTRVPLEIYLAVPVAIGTKQPIIAITKPETASKEFLKWTSYNKDIATVDENGIVTGVSKGLANIYVSSDISHWGRFFLVYVYEPEPTPVAVNSITIDPMIVDNAKTGDRINLTATVLPENANDKTVTWSSSNESVATVSTDGVVDIVAPGTAVITATANDGSGVKGVCLISGLSSLDDVVYTSPADKKDVYTVDGKLIMRSATRDDLNTLAPGIYLVGDMKIAIR